MRLRKKILIVVFLLLWPTVPFLIALGLSSLFHCEVNEDGVKPCIIAGHDFGKLFYGIIAGWGFIASISLALLLLGIVVVFRLAWFIFSPKKQKYDRDGSKTKKIK